MNLRKKTLWESAWYLLIFAFLYIWFTQVHPLVIFDADDWTYLTPDREAWPIWGEWNPAKVFPEVFMPLCSTVGSFLLMPLVKDYITVMTITHGFVVSTFITVYIYALAQLLKRVFSLDVWAAVYAGALFLIFHFLAMRGAETDNLYLFYCKDLNCYYNYLIPALLNGSIVLWMIRNDAFEEFLKNGSAAAKGVFLLVLYMAIFSNLVDSVILAVYAGARLLVDFLKQVKKPDWKVYLKDHTLFLGIFAAWLVSAVFELSGGRAGAGASGSLFGRLKDSAYCLFEVLKNCNMLFLILCALIVAAAAVIFFLGKRQDKGFLDLAVLWVVGVAAMVFCMVVLCALVSPAYMYRAEYLFGVFFYCLVFVMLCFGYVVQKQPKVLLILPILLCVLVSETDTKEKTFQESNMGNLDPAICAEISRDLLTQVTAACESGQTEMILYVPLWDTEDNWPHAVQLMDRMRHALYAHRIIGYPIDMTIEPSAEINGAYHLDSPIPYTG